MKSTKKPRRRRKPDLLLELDRVRAESSDVQVRALLHELQVHSEAMIVQNEQLLKAQSELVEARDRYADLYDFAPIGYLSLDQGGIICEINLPGAALLGQARQYLLGAPLAALVATEDRFRFREFLHRSQQTTDGVMPDVEVSIKKSDCIVRLIARPMTHRERNQLFTAMVDVTERRRLEEERQRIHEAERQKAAALAREVAVRLMAEERVKALLDRLVEVQEQERRRLALNLHDQLGQQLTALRLTIDALRAVDPASADGRARFAMMEQIVTQMDRDVDFLAWDLRPAALDDVGLEAALQEFIRQWSSTQGIEAEFHSTLGDGARLPRDVESHLYRIVQEALNNVGKHAQAAHVSVLLERRGDEVRLIIEDNGRGFDLEAVRGKRGSGMGLAGMQERAASIGGDLQLESSPGKGTTLFVRLPIKPPARAQ